MGGREQLAVPRHGAHCSYLARRRVDTAARPEHNKRRRALPPCAHEAATRATLWFINELAMIQQRFIKVPGGGGARWVGASN